MPRPLVALATCSSLPDLDAEGAALLPALQQRGVQADATVWDDPRVDWSRYDLVVVRSTWDYSQRRDEFLTWAASVPRVLNPVEVLAWNTDKCYLSGLGERGVPVVPTLWLDPARHLTSRALHTRFPASGDFVIKPAVSAGSIDTGRYTSNNANSRGLAIQHARRLLDAGRTVMVQRYIQAVDTAGERGLVFIDGEYSHAVRKSAMLHGPDAGDSELYRTEAMSPTSATEAELTTARQVLDAARGLIPGQQRDPLLYARVDLVTDDAGAPLLMELELTEPSLFTPLAEGSLERFADAIAARV